MFLTYADTQITEAACKRSSKQLQPFKKGYTEALTSSEITAAVAAVTTWTDEAQLQAVHEVVGQFKKPKHVVLVGTGGSSLGTEAIHAVLATAQSPQLHVLDTVAPHELETVLTKLSKVKKAADIAVCVVSKSGTTVETLANAEVLIGSLEAQLGKNIWQQVVCVSDPKTELALTAKRRGAHVVAMPAIVGGRFSVFTSAGLVPLALLGHDVEAILAGVEDATTDSYLTIACDNAARLHTYLKAGVRHYNFFAFDTRLVRLGKWYRQLTAESLGKETKRNGKPLTLGFVPTISTAVDLHATGQLYFSQFPGVYTDFVALNDDTIDYRIPARTKLAPSLAKQTQQDIAAAIYAGVVDAYQERQLPYRSTIFDEGLDYSLGLFMATRMIEVIALAELMDVDAFTQPNVELYKKKTKKILKI